jgi:hypothetical protein
MATRLTLWRELFSQQPRTLLANAILPSRRSATRAAWRLRLENARGHLVVLPWLGQMIWDANSTGTT